MPLVDLESEVFAECGSWKNFWEMEDSLSLDELVVLYERTMERQNRLVETMAAAMGADVSRTSESDRSGDPVPAWQIDPSVGGEATPVFGADEAAALPIGLGYSTINRE